MSAQETLRYELAIVLSTEAGELPYPSDVEKLVRSQMAGTLDEDTGLTAIAVTLLRVTDDLE